MDDKELRERAEKLAREAECFVYANDYDFDRDKLSNAIFRELVLVRDAAKKFGCEHRYTTNYADGHSACMSCGTITKEVRKP